MQMAVVQWLDQLGSTAFTFSAWAFVLLNGYGVAMVAWRRDRAMVNRWTSRFLAANLLLLGVGLGVPTMTLAVRTAIVTLAPVMRIQPRASEAPAAADSIDAIKR